MFAVKLHIASDAGLVGCNVNGLCGLAVLQVVHAEANALLNKNQAHVAGAVRAHVSLAVIK